MFKRLADWLDDRTGYRGLLHVALDEPVKGGTRWAYVFGSSLAVVFGVQAVSGVALAAYYSPSTTDAWASINYLQTQVYLGWLLRGVHHFGASVMVVLLGLHLLQTVLYGAFRAPRELNWLAGFMLLQLVLALALTGYLLPWDQKGYWATQVATSIVGTLPLVGERLQHLLQGGPEYGNLTLTRFYALHVFVLPAGLVLFLIAHIYLFRRHGVTPPPGLSEGELQAKTEPFFPGQLFKDTLAALAAVGIIFYLAISRGGAPLDAPADPASQYLARPEWYFLPLFQLLKYFHGPLEVVGTVVLPAAALSLLALLPFAHTLLRGTRTAHRVLATGVVLGLLAVVGLGALAAYEDGRDEGFARLALQARDEADRARGLAAVGVPVTGPLELYRNDAAAWGEHLFRQHCATCHQPCDVSPYKGDLCLQSYASREWLLRLIRDPQHELFFKNTGIDEMDPYTGTQHAAEAIVEFVYSQGDRPDVDATLATLGAELFVKEGCESCHTVDGEGNGLAPDLKGYASTPWLAAFIRRPDAERFYGDKNKMDKFDPDHLADVDLARIIAYLRAQAREPLKFSAALPSKPASLVKE